jgi:ADP-glucose pyrophosphorylase
LKRPTLNKRDSPGHWQSYSPAARANAYTLTKHRAKPAVPSSEGFIDHRLRSSNCINSQLKRICVLTQYKSDSLRSSHPSRLERLSYERGEFIFTIPPQFRASEKWYQGRLTLGVSNIYTIERESPDYVLISAATTSTKWTTANCWSFMSRWAPM